MPTCGRGPRNAVIGILVAGFFALSPACCRALDSGVVKLAEEGLSSLYALEFNSAMASFEKLRRAYPQHPAGPALMAATTWWQARYWFAKPDEAAGEAMNIHLAEAISLSRKLLETPETSCEGSFFLGATLGIKAYWEMIQNKWIRAVLDAREAVDVLKPALSCTEFAAEAAFGLGIYEYHASRLPWHLKWLSSFLISDMTDGKNAIARFKVAAEESRFMRNDAQGTLALILSLYDPDPPEAIRYATLLTSERPGSPMAHGLMLQALAVGGKWSEVIRAADSLLKKDSPFESESATYLYWKGIAFLGLKLPQEAAVVFSRAVSSPGRAPWITASYLKRGCCYDLLGKRKEARADYAAVLKRADPWHAGKRARIYLSRKFTWADFPREVSPKGTG